MRCMLNIAPRLKHIRLDIQVVLSAPCLLMELCTLLHTAAARGVENFDLKLHFIMGLNESDGRLLLFLLDV